MDNACKLARAIKAKREELRLLEEEYARVAPRAELTTKPRTVRDLVEMYGSQTFSSLMKFTGLQRADLCQQCQLHGLHQWPDGRYHLEEMG